MTYGYTKLSTVMQMCQNAEYLEIVFESLDKTNNKLSTLGRMQSSPLLLFRPPGFRAPSLTRARQLKVPRSFFPKQISSIPDSFHPNMGKEKLSFQLKTPKGTKDCKV